MCVCSLKWTAAFKGCDVKKQSRDNRQTPSSPSNSRSAALPWSSTLVGISSDLSSDPERVGRTLPCLSPIESEKARQTASEGDSSSRTHVFLNAYLDADDSSDEMAAVPGRALVSEAVLSSSPRSPVHHEERTGMLDLRHFGEDDWSAELTKARSAVSPPPLKPAKKPAFAVNLSSPRKPEDDGIDPPVIHHFEGTNEIFIKSSVFDSICHDQEVSSRSQNSVQGIGEKLSLPTIPPPPSCHGKGSLIQSSRAESSNFFGIVSSGILPTVDIDKSFDLPCIEDDSVSQDFAVLESEADPAMHSVDANMAYLEEEASKSSLNVKVTKHIEGTGEVFVSKLMHEASAVSAHQSEPSSKCSQFGLPSRDASAETDLHPEDLRGELGTISPLVQFAMDAMFHPHRCDLLGVDVEDIGLERTIFKLEEVLKSVVHAEHPVTVSLHSTCGLSIERVTRKFLRQCAERHPRFQAYTTGMAPDGVRHDLVTMLVASRVGCFPNAPEEIRAEALGQSAEKLFEPQDLLWGTNILYVRYGLPRLLSNPNDAATLAVHNESDMLELLLNIIQHDALHGPVVIAISQSCMGCGHAWRDILRQLQVLPSGNILILLTDCHEEAITSLRDVETIEIPSYPPSELRALLYQVFSESGLSMTLADVLISKCGTRFVDLRRLLCLVRERGLFQVLQNTHDAAEMQTVLKAIPSDAKLISDACYASFGQAQRRFLSVASLLGDSFYLADLIFVLSLEPLDGEIAWFRDLRAEWCIQVAHSLLHTGELILLYEDEVRGPRYNIPDAGLYRSRIQQIDPALIRRVSGCYAHLLERKEADDASIAEAFEKAHLWPEYTRYILKIAQKLGNAFYNRSAYAILQNCLSHIGPQHDSIYAELLRATIEQAMRLGKYDEACACAEILSRYGYLVQDPLCSCTAFLQLGTCLRMQGEYERAQDVLLFAIKHAETKHHDRLIAMGYHALAELVLDVGEKGALVNALRYAEKSLEISRKCGDLTSVAATQTLCGRIYMLRGEPLRAKTAANEAYQALTVSGRWYDTPWPLAVLAESCGALGESLPLDYLENGFDIADKTGNVAQQFMLLTTRLKMTIHTLQRQAIRDDLAWMAEIIEKQPLLPWIAQYHYFVAQFDYSRKNFHKTSDALKIFFDYASKLGNTYLMSQGYALSAVLNFEVHRRKLSKISLDKTDKLYRTSTAAFESVGAWHEVAENLRHYASFLEHAGRTEEAENSIKRANKVDPYCQ